MLRSLLDLSTKDAKDFSLLASQNNCFFSCLLSEKYNRPIQNVLKITKTLLIIGKNGLVEIGEMPVDKIFTWKFKDIKDYDKGIFLKNSDCSKIMVKASNILKTFL